MAMTDAIKSGVTFAILDRVGGNKIGAAPVSYTHLDVYKRQHLSKRFPGVELTVRQEVYMGVWDELRHHGGQMAIGVPGFHTIDEEFSTAPLGIVNWVFVVAPEHPLATAPKPLGNDLLRRFPAVNVEDTAWQLTKRTAWRLSGQSEIIVPDLDAKIACHVRGLGGGFLPNAKVRQLIQRHQLTKCQVVVGRQPSPLALAWRREGAGKITAYLRDLCLARDDLVQPLFAAMDPATTDSSSAGSAGSDPRP